MGQASWSIAVICCYWVKLFNPRGINHRWRVRNLCAETMLEYSAVYAVVRNIRGQRAIPLNP